VRGTTNSKIGAAIITNERLLFFDQKFAPNAAAGVLTTLIVDRLQKRHEAAGPFPRRAAHDGHHGDTSEEAAQQGADLDQHHRWRAPVQRWLVEVEPGATTGAHGLRTDDRR